MFIAADVFVYIGDLSPIFSAISMRAKKGALFVFSTERRDEDGFELQSTGRYVHSDAYIHECAGASDLTVLHSSKIALRRENNDILPGGVYVLEK